MRDDAYAVCQFADIVAFAVPWRQRPEVVLHRVALHGKIAVYDRDELLHVDVHALFLHLHPDRVEDVVIQVHPLQELRISRHAAHYLVPAGHHVALYLVSHREPLLDILHGSLPTIRLALSEIVPGAEPFRLLVARLDDGSRVGIFVREMSFGIVESLPEFDAIAVADASEVHHILVVAVRFEDESPVVERFQYMHLHLLHGRFLRRQFDAIGFASLSHLGAFSSLLLAVLLAQQGGGELSQFLVGEDYRFGIPVEEGLFVVGESRQP